MAALERLRSVIAFLLLLQVAIAAEVQKSVDIYAWPLSEAKPQLYAKVSYSPSTSETTVTQLTSPKIPASEEFVRVGFYRSSGKDWSGVAVSPLTFDAGRERLLQLRLDDKDDVYHIGLLSNPKIDAAPTKGQKTRKARPAGKLQEGDIRVELVKQTPGPQPVLNKPVAVTPDGKVADGKEPEKTWLQKYWWVLALFMVLQLFMAPAGDK